MSRYLDDKEFAEHYPLLNAMIGRVKVQRIDGPGMTGAHMIFAPEIERALAEMGQVHLMNQFEVQVKRKPRRRKSQMDKGGE